jgi:FtsZ-binding cell division protein ZapB
MERVGKGLPRSSVFVTKPFGVLTLEKHGRWFINMEHKLYQFPEAIDRILAESEDGELTPDQAAALDRVLGKLQEKVRSVVGVIRHLEMLADGCKDEKDRLASRQRSLSRQVDSLKEYLLRCMADEETARIVTDIGTVSRVANSRPSIRWAWTDREPPEEFQRVKVELDGQKAYEAYKAGTLPDGFLVETGESLRVR